MIDVEKFENYVSKRSELMAETKVCEQLNDFVFENRIKCRNEHNFVELQAWLEVSNDIKEIIERRLNSVQLEIKKLREQLDEEEA